jgi:hypothetical protein
MKPPQLHTRELVVEAHTPKKSTTGPVLKENILEKLGKREVRKGEEDVKNSGVGGTYWDQTERDKAWEKFNQGHKRIENGEKTRGLGKILGDTLDGEK